MVTFVTIKKRGQHMAYRVNHVNKTTGTTYVYEVVSFWDKNKKQSRNKQVCVGKLDPVHFLILRAQ